MPMNQHAIDRAQERYGLKMSRAEMATIEERAAAQVKRGISIKMTNSRHLCPIEWEGTVLLAIYSKKSKAIVTFLPPEVPA